MSKKVFNVFSILCFALVLCFMGCTELINPKTETDINLNIDLSKIIKSTRNTGETQSSASLGENPTIKVAIYDAKKYTATTNSTENLGLITEAQAKIVDNEAKVKLNNIPVGIYAIVFAELSFSNGNSTEVMYAGKSKVFKVKASDNKISLVLIKVGVDDEDKPDDSNTPYEISSWDELVDLVTKINSLSDVTTTTEFIIMNDLIATCTITVSKPVKITSDKKLIITRDSEFSGEFFHIDTGSLELGSIILDGGNQNDINATYPLISSSGNGLTLTNCTLQNNTLNNINASFGNGGAVYVSGGTFTMNNSSITNCSANENGGAVYVSGGTFTMNDGVTITNCDAKDGGAVYITDGGTFTMKDDASISNCTATNSGGGVWMNNGSSFTMSGGKIDMCNSNSEGGGGGGGVYVTGEDNPCTFKMLDSATITGCSALNGGGGGVSYGCGPNGTFEISGEAKINNNHSTCGGDGIYLYGKLTMTGGTISSNNDASNGNGVGVYVRNVNDVLSSLSMSGNAIVESYDYVYLESGTTVTVAGDLTAEKVATIMLDSYTEGTQVLKAETGELLSQSVGKFALADTSGKFTIDSEGKIAKVIFLTQGVLDSNITTNSRYDLTAGEYCVTEDIVLSYPIQIDASNGDVKIYSNENKKITCSSNFSYISSDSYNAMIALPMSSGSLTLGGGTGNLTIDGSDYKNLSYLVFSSSSLTLEKNCTITNGTVSDGAVYIGAGSFTMNGGTITNNNSTKCSGIYTTGNPTTPTTIRINNGTISNNFVNSENKGASIYCYNTNATVNLPDNSTVTSTSGMFTQNIINGEIQDLTTGGGNEPLVGTVVSSLENLQNAINGNDEVIIITSNITITEPLVINRKIKICTSDSNYQLARTTEGTVKGPMFEVTSTGELTLQNIIITGGYDNVSYDTENNPFIYNNGKTVIEKSTLKNNYFCYAGTYTNNDSEDIHIYGGGAIFSNGELTINNSSMENFNINTSYGGTIYIESGTCDIDVLTISRCYTNKNGAALYISANASSSTVNISNSNIVLNTADSNGGGIYAAAGIINIKYSEINNNSANNGNSVYFKKGVIYSINSDTLVTVSTSNGYNDNITSSTSSISIY